jgi:hypothetical protein
MRQITNVLVSLVPSSSAAFGQVPTSQTINGGTLNETAALSAGCHRGDDDAAAVVVDGFIRAVRGFGG